MMDSAHRRIVGSLAIEQEPDGQTWITTLPTMHSSSQITNLLFQQLEEACLHANTVIGIDLRAARHFSPRDRALLLARGRQLQPYALAVVVRSRAVQLGAMLLHALYGGRLPLRIFHCPARARAWLQTIQRGQRLLA